MAPTGKSNTSADGDSPLASKVSKTADSRRSSTSSSSSCGKRKSRKCKQSMQQPNSEAQAAAFSSPAKRTLIGNYNNDSASTANATKPEAHEASELRRALRNVNFMLFALVCCIGGLSVFGLQYINARLNHPRLLATRAEVEEMVEHYLRNNIDKFSEDLIAHVRESAEFR